jgi:hypothetical protein
MKGAVCRLSTPYRNFRCLLCCSTVSIAWRVPSALPFKAQQLFVISLAWLLCQPGVAVKVPVQQNICCVCLVHMHALWLAAADYALSSVLYIQVVQPCVQAS